MYDYDIKDKTYAGVKKRKFPYFSVGLIIVGTGMLIGGGIWYANSDIDEYQGEEITTVSEQIDGSKVEKVNITVAANVTHGRTLLFLKLTALSISFSLISKEIITQDLLI